VIFSQTHLVTLPLSAKKLLGRDFLFKIFVLFVKISICSKFCSKFLFYPDDPDEHYGRFFSQTHLVTLPLAAKYWGANFCSKFLFYPDDPAPLRPRKLPPPPLGYSTRSR
jgi:hypothetical protein